MKHSRWEWCRKGHGERTERKGREMNPVGAREGDTATSTGQPRWIPAPQSQLPAQTCCWVLVIKRHCKWLWAAGTMPFEYKMSYVRAWNLLILIFWLFILSEHNSWSHSWANKVFQVKKWHKFMTVYPTWNSEVSHLPSPDSLKIYWLPKYF